jgi:hypothetical protein
MSNKFDSHMRRETDKGKFASREASADSMSQGIKRKVDEKMGVKKPPRPNPYAGGKSC